jgi:ribonuclease J
MIWADAIRHDTATAAGDVRVFIHRGTKQIGGTCIELACEGSRILLDLGLPLDAGDTDPATLMPDVAGLRAADPGLLALVVSHGHADHWGLAPFAAPGLGIITGAATRRIMGAAAAFVSRAVAFAESGEGDLDLVDRRTIQVGPFSITRYLVDR